VAAQSKGSLATALLALGWQQGISTPGVRLSSSSFEQTAIRWISTLNSPRIISVPSAGRRLLGLVLLLVLLACPQVGQAYSVLTHEALVDSLWDDAIKTALLQRFPDATEGELKISHGYTYGGCIIQDLGYYPFGTRYFSDLVHYVRSADFLQALLHESRDLNEYAFALGAVSHYGADVEGHSRGVNRAVPILYPKLRRKFGDEVTYGDDPTTHLKTEFGFDVLEVARGHYAPKAYHDSIGFHVSKELLERAFQRTYGLKLTDIFHRLDLALETYRYSIRTLIPEMTKAAWAAKSKEIMKQDPGISRKRFLYNISRASYEKDWGTDYQRPGLGARFLAFLFRLVPKFGPLKGFAFPVPPAQVERMFEASFDAAAQRNRLSYAQAEQGGLKLTNRDLDTGKPVSPGEYALTDKTYDKLLVKLAENEFNGVTPDIRDNILSFYDAMKSSDPHGIDTQLRLLRAYRPVADAPVSNGH